MNLCHISLAIPLSPDSNLFPVLVLLAVHFNQRRSIQEQRDLDVPSKLDKRGLERELALPLADAGDAGEVDLHG